MRFYIVKEFYENLSPNVYTINEESIFDILKSVAEDFEDGDIVGYSVSLFEYEGHNFKFTFKFISRESFGNVPGQEQGEVPF